MHNKIQMKFPEPGQFLDQFLNSISQGHLALALGNKYELGEELELEVKIPDLEKSLKIQARVQARSLDNNFIDALITNQSQVEKLLNRLYELPAYNEFMEEQGGKEKQIETEEIDEQVYEDEDADQEGQAGPVIIIKARMPSARDCLPVSTEIIRQGKPLKFKSGKVPMAKLKPEPPRIIVSLPRTGIVPIGKLKLHLKREKAQTPPAPSEQSEIPRRQEKPIPGPEPALLPDPLHQLRQWLALDQEPIIEIEDEAGPEASAGEAREISRPGAPKDLGPVSHFIQGLLKALLRQSYYSPDHPGYLPARERLYRDFKNAGSDTEEIGMVLAPQPEAEPEFFITGISDPPITLQKLMGIGSAEFFSPQYLEYFRQIRLLGLFIKSSITEDRFRRFLEIMSDAGAESGAPPDRLGKLLTGILIESQIKEVTVIFEDDLIYLDSPPGWQLEMAIHRLAKELKILPLFKPVTLSQMPGLKREIIQNILRPLSRPEQLKDLILNLEAIARQVPGLEEEDPETDCIQNLPAPLLIPCAVLIFQGLPPLNQLRPETEEEKGLLSLRIDSSRRVLGKIAHRVVREKISGAEELLEQLFFNELLTINDLPAALRKKVNQELMTDQFQKQPYFWLGRFAEARSARDLELLVRYFSKIIPALMQRRDWQNLYLLTETVSKIPEDKQKLLAPAGIPELPKAVWAGQAPELIRILLEESPEMRKGVEEIFLLLGEFGIQELYQKLLKEPDATRKKFLIESLIKFGPRSIERLRDLLKDPAKPANLQMLGLEVIGRNQDPADLDLAQSFLSHPQPELRAQAVSALVRIKGPEAMNLMEHLFSDPHPLVRKRVIAMLGLLAGDNQPARTKLMEIAFDPEAQDEFRAMALQELGRNLPDMEKERRKLREKLLNLISEREKLGKKIRKKFWSRNQAPDQFKLASLNLLAKLNGIRS